MMSTAEAYESATELRWFMKLGDVRHGPYTRGQIARYVGEGRIGAHTLLSREGLEDWRIARDDPALADLFESATIPPPPQTALVQGTSDKFWAHVVYGIYTSVLVFVSAPLMIVGAILAHLNRNMARGTWLESHYLWQVRTFWIGLVLFLVGQLTWFFLVAGIFLAAAWLWMIYRAIKGWILLSRDEPIEDPLSLW